MSLRKYTRAESYEPVKVIDLRTEEGKKALAKELQDAKSGEQKQS